MSFFDTIRQKRLGDKPLRYLWELRVSDAEYVELKQLLYGYVRSFSRNSNNRFITVYKECALFVSEYWRREYVDGPHTKEMLFRAIDSIYNDETVIDEFYEAAKSGARSLKLELFEGDGGKRYLDSMLYQGGLPMKLVTESDTNSVWDRFTRGLVNRKINFDELNLGIVASNSQCLKDYCNQLILGIESERHMLMPFYCQNENDVWFLYLKELAKQERIKRSQQIPFHLSFELKVDHIEKNITIKYVVKGSQRLAQAFLEQQGLLGVNFFSLQVRKNGQAVDTFDFVNNFCRYSVISKHPYIDGDIISIYLHNHEEPFLRDELDMDVPHLLYRDKDGKYILGNHLGKDDSLLLIPEGWNVLNEESYEVCDYTYGERTLQAIIIGTENSEDIKVTSKDGEITFGKNAAFYWTDVQSTPIYTPDILEPVYNAEKCSFALCYDTNDVEGTKRCNVQYRNKWQNEWSDIPSLGEIFVRAIDLSGHYVTPTRVINVGKGVAINILNANQDSCQIQISWPHGHVSTTEGEKKVNDVWAIKKENCEDPRRIKFLFTPDDNSRNQFYLSIKAPFKVFTIVDYNGKDIIDDSWIPYSDVDKYQYHLVGQDVKEYTYGNISRQLRWKGDKLHIIEDGRTVKTIPFEGSLVTLFDSREMLRSLLERTSQNMLNAEVKVQFILSDGNRISFSIKDCPFRPRQVDGNRVIIIGNNKRRVEFTGVLKLLKLSEPQLEPKEMSFNKETGFYELPEEIRSWGKTILIGRTRGRICPALVDLNAEMDGEARVNNRQTVIGLIEQKLQDSRMGDELWQRIIGWFERSQNDDIPASSILELYCTAKDYKSLLFLAFQLYTKCENAEEQEFLKEKLKSFSNDLSFQWYWLMPYLSTIMVHLDKFINDPSTPAIQEMYIKWAMEHDGEDRMNYLAALNEPDTYMTNILQCFGDVITAFTDWMKDLCVSSLLEKYDNWNYPIITTVAESIIKEPKKLTTMEMSNDTYIEYNQDYLGEEVGTFFNEFDETGKLGNEKWLCKRVNAVVAHLNKKIDLFSQKEEIRRSIIFCSKSCNYHFIIALNNKLRTSYYEV